MTAYLSDTVFDEGLSTLTSNTEYFYMLSADPGLTWGNIATYALGSKAAPTVSSPTDRTGGGRKVTISAFTDGVGMASGSATYFALTDDSESEILASGELASSISITTSEVFAITEFTIGIPNPA